MGTVPADGEGLRLDELERSQRMLSALERAAVAMDRFSVEPDKIDFHRSIIRDRKTEYRESSREVARQVLPGIAASLISFLLKRIGMDQMIGAPLVTTANGTHAVCLSVTDTGAGIPDDLLPHMFDPFDTTKDESRGTGLGLSVAYGILAQHDGWLTVETNPEQGTTFHAWVPVASDSSQDKASHRAAASSIELPSLVGRRVLVVEDDAAVRQLVVRGLERHGVHVTVGNAIAEARARLDIGDFDIVVSDVVLPDGSGASFCESAQSAYPHLRVILMSGYADQRVSHETIEARRWTFLRKPFSASQLAEAMAKSLR